MASPTMVLGEIERRHRHDGIARVEERVGLVFDLFEHGREELSLLASSHACRRAG